MESTLQYRNPIPGLLFVLILFALAALTLPAVTLSAHASLHEEAEQIRQCYADGRLNQVWLNSSGQRLNCLIDLPGDKVGDRVIQWCKRAGWVEITAYVIGDGGLAEAMAALKAKACAQVYP